jgi:hypothetical protein
MPRPPSSSLPNINNNRQNTHAPSQETVLSPSVVAGSAGLPTVGVMEHHKLTDTHKIFAKKCFKENPEMKAKDAIYKLVQTFWDDPAMVPLSRIGDKSIRVGFTKLWSQWRTDWLSTRNKNEPLPSVEEVSPYIYSLGGTQHLYYGSPGHDSTPHPPLLADPRVPPNLSKVFTFDKVTRVLSVNLRPKAAGTEPARRFSFQMMQRDDIAVVFDGVLPERLVGKDGVSYVTDRIKRDGNKHEKFRRFERQSRDEMFVEVDGTVSMTVTNYVKYLEKRKIAAKPLRQAAVSFEFYDGDSTLHVIEDVDLVVLYMIDYDLKSRDAVLLSDYQTTFKVPEIMLAGKKCMLNCVR